MLCFIKTSTSFWDIAAKHNQITRTVSQVYIFTLLACVFLKILQNTFSQTEFLGILEYREVISMIENSIVIGPIQVMETDIPWFVSS